MFIPQMGKPRRPGHSVWCLVGTQALEGISKVSTSSPQLQDTISSAHKAATELRLHRKPRLWRTHVVSRAVRTPRCRLNYVPTAGCFFLVPPFISQKFLHIQLVHLSYAANLRKKASPLVSPANTSASPHTNIWMPTSAGGVGGLE